MRRLPHNIEAEMAVIGSVFVYGQKAIERIGDLDADAFMLAEHQAIWRRCLEMVERGETPNPVTLRSWAEEHPVLAGAGVAYISTLADSSAALVDVGGYARTIADDARKRHIIELTDEISAKAYNGAIADDVVRDALREFGLFKPIDSGRNWIEASAVEPKNIDWLWKPRIIAGRINLIVGMGDVGKDTWCCRLVASLTNNLAWPDDQEPPRPMRVGMWCPEDEAADTIIPRLEAAGANRKLIRIWDKASPPSPDDVREVDAFFVSPLISLMGKDRSMNSEQDAREFLQLWQHGGQRTVIGTGHLSKKNDLAAVQRILGASGIVNFCRSTWLIQRDADDKNVRLFQRLKANLTPDDTSGLKFEIDWVGPWDQSIRANVTGTTETGADEVMQATVNGLGKQSAPAWLVEYLEEHGGIAQVSVIMQEGAKAGHKEKSLQNAQNRSNGRITSVREGGVAGKGQWWWKLS